MHTVAALVECVHYRVCPEGRRRPGSAGDGATDFARLLDDDGHRLLAAAAARTP